MKNVNPGGNVNHPMGNQSTRGCEYFGWEAVREPTGQGSTLYHFDTEVGFVPVTAPAPINGSSSSIMEKILEMLVRNQANQVTTLLTADFGEHFNFKNVLN